MAIPIPSDQTKQIGELEASLKAAISGVWKGSAGAADDLAAVLPSKACWHDSMAPRRVLRGSAQVVEVVGALQASITGLTLEWDGPWLHGPAGSPPAGSPPDTLLLGYWHASGTYAGGDVPLPGLEAMEAPPSTAPAAAGSGGGGDAGVVATHTTSLPATRQSCALTWSGSILVRAAPAPSSSVLEAAEVWWQWDPLLLYQQASAAHTAAAPAQPLPASSRAAGGSPGPGPAASAGSAAEVQGSGPQGTGPQAAAGAGSTSPPPVSVEGLGLEEDLPARAALAARVARAAAAAHADEAAAVQAAQAVAAAARAAEAGLHGAGSSGEADAGIKDALHARLQAANARVVDMYFHVYNTGHYAALDDIVGDEYCYLGLIDLQGKRGVPGMRAMMSGWRDAVPNLVIGHELVGVVGADRVVFRWIIQGHHLGPAPLLRVPPPAPASPAPAPRLHVHGVTALTVRGGRIVQKVSHANGAATLRLLGRPLVL